MIIDPSLATYDDIKAALVAYAESKDTPKWRDLKESSAGMTLIEMIAGLGAYDAYRIGMAERNATLDFAASRSALIMKAALLGYPVNRPVAPILRLTINSPVETAFWNRVNPIGLVTTSAGTRKLSLRTSQTIAAGVSVVDVYVGCWKEWSYTSANAEPFQRLYIEDEQADNDLTRFELLSNEMEEIALTHYAEKLDDANVLLRTTVDGFFLQFGDGSTGRALGFEDLALNYLATDGKLKDTLTVSDIQLNVGELDAFSVLHKGYDADSDHKIRTLAPSYYSTHRTMVSRQDHITLTKSFSGDVLSADARKKPDACCVVEVCPLFNDEHTPTSIEKTQLKEYLSEWKPAGEELEIVDPIRVGLDIEILLIVNDNQLEENIESQVLDIINEQTLQLNTTFFPGQVIREVARLPGVKRVYLHHPASDRVSAFGEYLSVDRLNLKLAQNPDTVIFHDPDNTGYIT